MKSHHCARIQLQPSQNGRPNQWITARAANKKTEGSKLICPSNYNSIVFKTAFWVYFVSDIGPYAWWWYVQFEQHIDDQYLYHFRQYCTWIFCENSNARQLTILDNRCIIYRPKMTNIKWNPLFFWLLFVVSP